MERKMVGKEEREAAIKTVQTELDLQMIKKGEGSFASPHEIYSVLTEEMNELLDEITRTHPGEILDSRSWKICKELAQIAVAAIFGIASIKAKGVDWL